MNNKLRCLLIIQKNQKIENFRFESSDGSDLEIRVSRTLNFVKMLKALNYNLNFSINGEVSQNSSIRRMGRLGFFLVNKRRIRSIFLGKFYEIEFLLNTNTEVEVFHMELEGKFWISRAAVLSGFKPIDIDVSLELSLYGDKNYPNIFLLALNNQSKSQMDEVILKKTQMYNHTNYGQSIILLGWQVWFGQICTDGQYFLSVLNRQSPRFPLVNIVDDVQIAVRKPRKFSALDEAIFIKIESNWWHFFSETCPRLLKIKNSGVKGVPVIIQGNLPLSIIDVVTEISGVVPITLDLSQGLCIKSLHIYIESADFNGLLFESNLPAMLEIANSLIKKFKNCDTKLLIDSRKFFLYRSFDSYRPMRNKRSIIKKLTSMGYVCLQLDDLTLQEQIQIVSTASVLILESGAGCTNLLFASKNCLFIELNPGFGDAGHWGRFASQLGLRHVLLEGTPRKISIQGFSRQGYRISLKRLTKYATISSH